MDTLLRRAEHKALSTITLDGSVLDLGGDARSEYRRLFRGEHQFTTVNLDEKARPDILHDLEEPLPLGDASYDNAILMNVLEHVFAYQQLLKEASRVVRPNGLVIIAVPFLFPIHPSPNDFWRFSPEALRREAEKAGLRVERIETLGTGVFAARFVMLDRLLPALLRIILYPLRLLAVLFDRAFASLAGVLGKKYQPSDYALGFVVVCRKAG